MSPLIHLNYPLDKPKILSRIQQLKQSSESYSDPRGTLDYWKIARSYDPVFLDIMDDFLVFGKPRIYWLEPNVVLPEHVDHNTTCSLNFILSEDPAPITIGGKDYFYRQCLLNTTIPHSVTNTSKERILLKISLFDVSYEDVVSLIPDQYKENNE